MGGLLRQSLSASRRFVVIELWREKCRALSVRRAAVTAGVLLGVVGGICHLYRASDAAVVTVAPPVRSCAAPGEIAGLSAAAQRAPLRNPFSPGHETAGERAAVPVPADAGNMRAAIPAEPPPAAQTPGTKLVPLVLRGTAVSADGARIAILAQGDEGAALSPGESWRGYTLDMVTDRAAVLRSASGMVTLTRE